MIFDFLGRKRDANFQKTAEIPLGLRVYAIGDVHGCSMLLEKMHAMIESDLLGGRPEKTLIIYLGDYLDRGPASAGVLDILTGAAPNATSRIFLKGNHEEMALKFLEDPEEGSAWCAFGGFETLMSYRIDVRRQLDDGGYKNLRREWAKRMPASHTHFLRDLQTSYSLGGYFFCHAGVRPGVSLNAQTAHDLMWIREDFLESAFNHGKLIVHGHSPVDMPDIRANRINVDTGAYATGRLTALVLEGAERRFLST